MAAIINAFEAMEGPSQREQSIVKKSQSDKSQAELKVQTCLKA